MNSLKIYIGNITYQLQHRSSLIDPLKPLIPEKNLNKYGLSSIPIEIVKDASISDCYFLPFCWNYYLSGNNKPVAEQMIKEASDKDKKIFIWFTGDEFISLPQGDHIIGLYTGPYFSRVSKQKIIPLPIVIKDPILNFDNKTIIKQNYSVKPIVGFCGQVDNHIFISLLKTIRRISQKFKYFLNWSPIFIDSVIPPTKLRKDILDKLEQCNNIQTCFIRRNRYKGKKLVNGNFDTNIKADFINNIKNTDYTVCIRGSGNFSTRFYETLALGRIPLFINTDCMLPFSNQIDWKKHLVWVANDEIFDIENKIINFHNSLGVESFLQLQNENRALWEKYFQFSGFLNQLILLLKEELSLS